MGGCNSAFEPGRLQVAAPYFISGRTGVLAAGMTPGEPVARLVQFGMQDPRTPGAIVPTPIQISQIRMRYAPTVTPATAARVFEILKGTGTQATGGTGTDATNLHLPQRRKTTGYPAILATETSLFMAGTDLITGGAFTPLDATGPLDIVQAGSLDGGWSIWQPSDLCPLQLEAGEALEVRIPQESASGSGILFLGIDLLR